MTNKRFPRRDFLKAGAAGVAAAPFANGRVAPAVAQPSVPASPGSRPADLILRNGKVITVDAGSTTASAIAVAGDRIIAVGPDAAMAHHAAPTTRILDLDRRTVIPGLIDGHAHMDREALRGIFPSLGKVRSIRDIQDRIAELARAKAPGAWIVTMPIGDPPYYFDVPELLAEKRWPTRQELDAAAPDHPVYIRSIWGYWRGTMPLVSCANTQALRRAGVDRNTISPVETLTIEKDANGDPTGVFTEREMAPIAELIWFREATRFTSADRLRVLPESARAYHGFATTSVFEGHGAATELLKRGPPRRVAAHANDACFQPELDGGRRRPAGAVPGGVGGMARRTGARRRLAQDGRALRAGRALGRGRRAGGRRSLHRMGRFQFQPRPAAPPGQGGIAALRQKRHPAGHDRVVQSRPL